MRVLLAFVADYASLDASGKMNAVGIFRDINAPVLPTKLNGMYLAYRIECSPGELDRDLVLRIALHDQDGNQLIEIGPMGIRLGRIPGTEGPMEFPMVFRIDEWPLEKAGDYQWALHLNDMEQHTLKMRVVAPPAPPRPGETDGKRNPEE